MDDGAEDNGKIHQVAEGPGAGNRVFYDSDITGFGARITAAGVVSFVLNYYARGRERRYTIGRYPELNASCGAREALALRESSGRAAIPWAQTGGARRAHRR